MPNLVIKIKKLYPDAKCFSYAHKEDAGADIYAYTSHEIGPNSIERISTGIAVELPFNTEMQIRSRSGLASKGIIVANSPGTIDSNYRGEILVLLWNTTKDVYVVKKGDRIAQAVFNILPSVRFTEVETLSPTDRNFGGFGSTGI